MLNKLKSKKPLNCSKEIGGGIYPAARSGKPGFRVAEKRNPENQQRLWEVTRMPAIVSDDIGHLLSERCLDKIEDAQQDR